VLKGNDFMSKKAILTVIKDSTKFVSEKSTSFSAMWFFYQPKCPKTLINVSSMKNRYENQ
jgi:cyclic lactone autoinducer peptide